MQAMTPPMNPMTMEVRGVNVPAAGVIVTRPATAPEAMPREVAARSRIVSQSIQPSIAAATVVLIQARPAMPSAAKAEPPLKPYQPNHSSAAPSITIGRLCGRPTLEGKPARLPTIRARTSDALMSIQAEFPEVSTS